MKLIPMVIVQINWDSTQTLLRAVNIYNRYITSIMYHYVAVVINWIKACIILPEKDTVWILLQK